MKSGTYLRNSYSPTTWEGYFILFLLMMKTKIFYSICLCLFIFLGIILRNTFKYQIITFSLDEQIFGYSHISGEETKLPTYWAHGVEKVKFFMKDIEPVPNIENIREKRELDETFFSPEGIAFYYAYPLSRLQVDLFINKAEIIFADQYSSVFIDKNSPEDTDSWRFTSYQKPGRKKKEILAFLAALAAFETDKARDMLMKDKDILPFNRLHFEFKEIVAGEDKLYGSILFEGGGGPDFYDFQLFISRTTLYFLLTAQA